jgi:hypothetical protein
MTVTEFQPFEDFELDIQTGKISVTSIGKEKLTKNLMQDKYDRETLLKAANINYAINQIVQNHENALQTILNQDKVHKDLIVSYMIGILGNKKYIPSIKIENVLNK